MGRLAGLGSAKVRHGGLYFEPGNYQVRVLRVAMVQSRKREDLFVVECEVLESDVPTRPKGCRPSWVVNLKQDAALGNIKGFLAACLGIEDPNDEHAVSEAEWEQAGEMAIGADNPLAGAELALTCVTKETRTGTDFTLHTWSPLTGDV